MSEMRSYENGVPCWIDATSTDIAVTKAFYEGLFAWDLEDLGPEAGGYVMCRKEGARVAALSPRMEGDPAPPHWNVYLACDDVDATVEKVRTAGGMVALEPMDVMDAGRMAFAADPSGAFFGLWQAGEHPGGERVNEPAAFTWAELQTRDIEAALPFYQAVFGYQVRTSPMGQITYHELLAAGSGQSIAGAFAMPDGMFPPTVPAHWAAYIGIADIDAGARKVRDLGGQQMMEPVEIPLGRFATFGDANGAVFSLFESSQAS